MRRLDPRTQSLKPGALRWAHVKKHSGVHISCNYDEEVRRWRCTARYGLSAWTIGLNEMTPQQERELPPSDVRRRRDVRLCEEGRYEEVNCCGIGAQRRIGPITHPYVCSCLSRHGPWHGMQFCMASTQVVHKVATRTVTCKPTPSA